MARYRYSVAARRRTEGDVADGATMVVYSDPAGTVEADISLTQGGGSIGGSQITLDAIGGAVFYGPNDLTDTLYVRFPADPSLGVQTIYCDYDPRVDVLEAGGGGGGVGTHNADTTFVHGIEDTTQIIVREALTQAVIDGKAATGQALHLAAGTHSVPVALNLYPSVPIIGEAADFGASKGTLIQGASGVDVFELEQTGGDYSGYHLEHLKISGGRNQLVLSGNGRSATHLSLLNVEFDGPSESGVLIDQGAIEEWYLDHVTFQGGQYGFRKISGGDADVSDNYIDKSTFKDCLWGGQTKSGLHVDARFANTVTFINPVFNLIAEHAFSWRGAIRSLEVVNPNTEQCGTSGKKNRTTLTGTVSAGATSGTLASATGWATGDQITIMGAGAGGTDFSEAVTISGTTATWTTPTDTTVSTPKVTNAKWDEFHFEQIPAISGPAQIGFTGGIVASEGSLGRLRYSVYVPGFYVSFRGLSGGVGSDIPAYVSSSYVDARGGNLLLRVLGRQYDLGEEGAFAKGQAIHDGGLQFASTTLQAASASAGAATLPANPVGFFIVKDASGTSRKIPYYAT